MTITTTSRLRLGAPVLRVIARRIGAAVRSVAERRIGLRKL